MLVESTMSVNSTVANTRSTSGKELWIAEHWTLRDEKVLSIMVFYHDTTPLMTS